MTSMVKSKTEFPGRFLEATGKPVREQVLLREHSNFRIGGPADYFFEAISLNELKSAIRVAREDRVPFYLMGGGFNILFDDQGFRGFILKNSIRGLEACGPGAGLRAEAGTPLGELVDFAAERSLEGFEFLAGIPGTVGGAVFGNAGAFGQSIGDFLEEASLLNNGGEEFRVPRDYFGFRYRHSKLKIEHDILLETKFRLRPGDERRIRTKIGENLGVRAGKHPPRETAYAGSFFKNPTLSDGTKTAAGYLLEQVGARELKIGGAAVYPDHCNFLINAGRATARDILALAVELKTRVKEKFGIELEEEVIFLPATASGF